MKLRHKVRINVAEKNRNKQKVLESVHLSLPRRFLKLLFGDFNEVLVLAPGDTVEGIEIKEVRGEKNER